MSNLIKKLIDFLKSKRGKELIRYLLVGGLTTFVSFSSYIIFLQLGMEVNLSNSMSVFLAIIFAYITNKKFVFKSKTENTILFMREFMFFMISRGISMILEIIGVFILFNLLGVGKILSKIIISIFVFVINYLFSKKLVFKIGEGHE